MTDETKEVAVEGPGGLKAAAKGYKLVELIWLPILIIVGWTAITLQAHEVSAKEEKAVLAKALKESNAEVANALKESNAAIVGAIERLAAEQKRSTDAMTEMACLSDPAMRNRPDARDVCKRLTRRER